MEQKDDKEAAVTAFRQTFEKTVGIGHRIDLLFTMIRLGLFHMDHELVQGNIAKAKELMEQGGDWERKNRLHAYEGIYKMAVGDWAGAADLFLESVPTFCAYELMSYDQLVFYIVVVAMQAFDRPTLHSRVIQCPQVQQQLRAENTSETVGLATAKLLLDAFYGCRYDDFFQALAQLEVGHLKLDRYLQPHYHQITRAMRLKAYEQFLTPYKMVRLEAMAHAFGVSRRFLDAELHASIASGQLNGCYRIDAIRGLIEVRQSNKKDLLYKQLVNDGDRLQGRLQKLTRMIAK